WFDSPDRCAAEWAGCKLHRNDRIILPMIRSLSIAVMLALCAAADAQVQTVTFTQRSPHSDPATLSRRFRWEPLKATADYNLADEPFSLRLPAAGDAEAKPGLIVWINSDAGGAPPKAFVEVLDRHNLIW